MRNQEIRSLDEQIIASIRLAADEARYSGNLTDAAALLADNALKLRRKRPQYNPHDGIFRRL